MLAQLGPYIFEGLEAPKAISQGAGAKYGRISLINGKDVLQKTGDDLETIRLSLQLSIDFCDPASTMDSFKQFMEDGEVLPLIMGDGTIIGTYVITDMEKTFQKLAPDGFVEIAEMKLSLLEFAGEGEEGGGGAAMAGAAPAAAPPAAPASTPAAAVTNDLSEATTKVNRISEIVTGVKGKAEELQERAGEIKELAADVKELYEAAKEKVDETVKLVQRAAGLPASLNEAIRYANEVKEQATDVAKIDRLKEASEKVKTSAAPIAGFLITREGGN